MVVRLLVELYIYSVQIKSWAWGWQVYVQSVGNCMVCTTVRGVIILTDVIAKHLA